MYRKFTLISLVMVLWLSMPVFSAEQQTEGGTSEEGSLDEFIKIMDIEYERERTAQKASNVRDSNVDIAFTTDTLPTVLVYPVYPVDAIKNRVEGVVTLTGVVNDDGKLQNIEVTRSTSENFSQATITALEKSFFHPKNAGAIVKLTAKYTLASKD